MLPDNLEKYLKNVDRVVRDLSDSYVERYEVEYLTSNRINLRIRIRFIDGYLLELNESVVSEGMDIEHIGYRYHFQDDKNNLIIRYDNTPHFPELESYPNHKHTSSGVVATGQPSIVDAIIEATQIRKVKKS